MKPNYQLYLRLKLEQKEDFIDLQLQKRGFKLVKKTGLGIEQFRNYFYELAEAPEACDVHFKLVPGKNTTQTISINILPDFYPEQTEKIFDIIQQLDKSIPLNLLDLHVRNRFYEELHQQGKVNAFYVGLPKEEQQEVERKAFIPIDYALFSKNKMALQTESDTSNQSGGRAPDLNA